MSEVSPDPSAAVLVFATSGPDAEVGLCLGARRPAAVERLGAGAARGREILPAARRLLEAARLPAAALTALAVDVGPGSFTGVRVGVTAARALAFALGRPLLGVVSLEGLAARVDPSARVLCLRDAGRGTLYAALYAPVTRAPGPGPARTCLHGPTRVTPAALAGWPAADLACGEEAPRLVAQHALGLAAIRATCDVAAVLALALPRLAAGEGAEHARVLPLYLQASAPERLLAGESQAAPSASAPDRSTAP